MTPARTCLVFSSFTYRGWRAREPARSRFARPGVRGLLEGGVTVNSVRNGVGKQRRRRAVLVLVAGLAAVALVAVASGAVRATNPTFAAKRTLAGQSGVGGLTEIETGDLNGDGRDDLVVTRIAWPIAHQTFPIGIYLANGQGGYVDGSSMWDGPPPRTEHGRQILIADFNGDRRNDIFVADHGYDLPPFPGHADALALSTPAGKLVDASANLPSESGFSHSAAAADVNRDGAVDLFVGNICCADGAKPEILLNDGTGHFARASGVLPAEVTEITLGGFTRSLFVDTNGDGFPDLVLGAFRETRDSVVLLNDGTGHYRRLSGAMPPKALGDRAILISLAALDVNRDGRPDLLAGFQREDFSGRRIQVLIGDGTGRFRDETAERLPEQDAGEGWPYAIRVADLNSDGRLDFGVSVNGEINDRAPIYFDDGEAKYHPVAIRSSQPWLVFADANGDRRTDIISALGGEREQIDVQLQIVVPNAPTAVRATATRDSIRVSWQRFSAADRYEVWRASRGKPRRLIATTVAARLDDRTARRGVRYTYVARAVNAAGKGPFSKAVTAHRG